jgi:hypothetical protein
VWGGEEEGFNENHGGGLFFAQVTTKINCSKTMDITVY